MISAEEQGLVQIFKAEIQLLKGWSFHQQRATTVHWILQPTKDAT